MRKAGTIRKAVFPVAGMGSRFLPATKASPKEMMAIVDKPLIQYAVEEAVAAGITDMIFVTGRSKRFIEDHFDKAYELEAELEKKGKMELLRITQEVIPDGINCIYIRQSEPLGLGHAVLCAEPIVKDEPFAVVLADDFMMGGDSVMRQMVEVFSRRGRCEDHRDRGDQSEDRAGAVGRRAKKIGCLVAVVRVARCRARRRGWGSRSRWTRRRFRAARWCLPTMRRGSGMRSAGLRPRRRSRLYRACDAGYGGGDERAVVSLAGRGRRRFRIFWMASWWTAI